MPSARSNLRSDLFETASLLNFIAFFLQEHHKYHSAPQVIQQYTECSILLSCYACDISWFLNAEKYNLNYMLVRFQMFKPIPALVKFFLLQSLLHWYLIKHNFAKTHYKYISFGTNSEWIFLSLRVSTIDSAKRLFTRTSINMPYIHSLCITAWDVPLRAMTCMCGMPCIALKSDKV